MNLYEIVWKLYGIVWKKTMKLYEKKYEII